MEARTRAGRVRISVSISLRSDHCAGAWRIANDDGHGRFSRVFQDLLEAELRRRYGRDWADDVGPWDRTAEAGTAPA